MLQNKKFLVISRKSHMVALNSLKINKVIGLLIKYTNSASMRWISSAYPYREKGLLSEMVPCYSTQRGRLNIEIFFKFAGHRQPMKAVLDIDGVLYQGTEVDELTDAVIKSMSQSPRNTLDHTEIK